MSRMRRRALSALMLLVSLLVPMHVFAHEEVVSGSYVFTIGWASEPVIVGQPNGLDLFISTKAEGEHTEGDEHAHGAEVENAEATLQFAIEYGSVRQGFELRPVFGEPGHYTADIIPTREGQYMFHLAGAIDGETVAVSFEPEEVGPATRFEFPEPSAKASDLRAELDAALAQARAAQAIAITGAVLGVIGIGLGLYGLMRRR